MPVKSAHTPHATNTPQTFANAIPCQPPRARATLETSRQNLHYTHRCPPPRALQATNLQRGGAAGCLLSSWDPSRTSGPWNSPSADHGAQFGSGSRTDLQPKTKVDNDNTKSPVNFAHAV